MQYTISRQGQQYGPYSLADLQRYVAQGNISPDDLARSEGMEEWKPVSQILGNIPVQPAPPPPQGYGQVPFYSGMSPAGMPPPASTVNLPNGLHWALLLLLMIVTCGIFSWVWIFVQASFARRLRPENKCIIFYAIGLACVLCGQFISAVLRSASGDTMAFAPTGGLVVLGGVVLIVIGHFQLKDALEEYYNSEEPINLQLSGVMTFFFNTIYFQYHLNRIRRWKLTGVLQ